VGDVHATHRALLGDLRVDLHEDVPKPRERPRGLGIDPPEWVSGERRPGR
jgi:hypothetical protein